MAGGQIITKFKGPKKQIVKRNLHNSTGEMENLVTMIKLPRDVLLNEMNFIGKVRIAGTL